MQTSPEIHALKCPQCSGNLPPAADDYIVCPYCGSSLVVCQAAGREKRFSNQATAVSGEPSSQVVRGYKLKRIFCNDPEGTGMEVCSLLAPAGWRFQGGCRWLLDNPGMPAVVSFQIANPAGAEAFEVLPNMNFLWNSQAGLFSPQPGSRHFGAEVRPPVSIRDAFRQYVLPRYRSNIQGLRILKEEPVPDLPRLAKSEALVSPIGSVEGGKVRVEYAWQQWRFEEEIYGVVEVFHTPLQQGLFGANELYVWFIDALFSFRAQAGKLDSLSNLFRVMIGSFTANPEWYAAFKSVAQMLAQQQIQHIRSIGQIGAMVAQAGSQMREQNLNDWYARQAVFDQMATERSRQIRDVDGYFDPNRGEVVELPSGFGHAWANSLGEYIVTEDSFYNPNQESSQTWVELEPAMGG